MYFSKLYCFNLFAKLRLTKWKNIEILTINEILTLKFNNLSLNVCMKPCAIKYSYKFEMILFF